MPRCIYCSLDRRPKEFTREHVLQDGFGRYQNAPTLIGMVCGACNQYFGDTIDRELLREGIEGLERYHWGVKAPSEVSKFGGKHVVMRLLEVGELTNAEFVLEADSTGTQLLAKLKPGVWFARRDGNGFEWYGESDVENGSWRTNHDIDWKLGFKAVAEGDALDRVMTTLASQGVIPTTRRPLDIPMQGGPERVVQLEYTVTPEMYRAIAKIAFNYLTFVGGRDMALLPNFDAIRRYVRSGEEPALRPVITTDQPPYRTSLDGDRLPVVHFVGLSRHDSHRNLLGIVSLFGFQTHHILLSESYGGPWPTMQAHLFNPKDLSVRVWLAGKPLHLGSEHGAGA